MTQNGKRKRDSLSTVWHCERPPSGTVYLVVKETRDRKGVRHLHAIRILQEARSVRTPDVKR